MMMMRPPPQYSNKHKKKNRADRRGPGNFNNNYYNNRDGQNRPNNKYDRQNNYDRDNRSNNDSARQNSGDRRNNGHDRDNRKDHTAAADDPNAFENRPADSQPATWNNNNEGKKKSSRKKKNKGKNEMFGQENFPALVENGVAKEDGKKPAGTNSTAGYAAALKKKPAGAGEAVPLQAVVATAAAPPSISESTLQTKQLEQAMSKLNVDKETKEEEEQEFWEVEVPDVW
jgi:hypothetical protein